VYKITLHRFPVFPTSSDFLFVVQLFFTPLKSDHQEIKILNNIKNIFREKKMKNNN